MSEHKFIKLCFMCGSEYQMGPHQYDGKYIPKYQIGVCRGCYDGNWDGWAPHCEEKLIAHLKKQSLPVPERNEKGWLARE